eukprot:gnl/Chilomastix_cuspidata/1242.p2 GENE.gnl/Chilomastix_cuspidata/1242~~gnl/Chilomastix_cuspidata/1242.p2  ORF type:complete len:305 (-),score=128.41 gnl/Chilomastix_cuspidata/1242:24-938(-)
MSLPSRYNYATPHNQPAYAPRGSAQPGAYAGAYPGAPQAPGAYNPSGRFQPPYGAAHQHTAAHGYGGPGPSMPAGRYQPNPHNIRNPAPNPAQRVSPEALEMMNTPARPWTTAEEREKNDSLGELFALLRTLEYLEKSFAMDRVAYKDYAPLCEKMLTQVKMIRAGLGTIVRDVALFAKDFNLSCNLALERIRQARPAPPPGAHGNIARFVSEATASGITLKDALELGYRTVADINPRLMQLLAALEKCHDITPASFSFPAKLRSWISRCEAWGPGYGLSDEEFEALKYDLDVGMQDFQKSLAA